MRLLKIVATLVGVMIPLLTMTGGAGATVIAIEQERFDLTLIPSEPFDETQDTRRAPPPSATRSILSKVMSDVHEGRDPAEAVSRTDEQTKARKRQAALQAEVFTPFQMDIDPTGDGPNNLAETHKVAFSPVDGLFGGRGWAFFVESEYYQNAKKTIKSSERQILSTIATLNGREAKAARVGSQSSGSRGAVILGLISAFVLFSVVLVASVSRNG